MGWLTRVEPGVRFAVDWLVQKKAGGDQLIAAGFLDGRM